MKKLVTIFLIMSVMTFYAHACSKSKTPAQEEILTPEPEPSQPKPKELKPEDYPNLVWIYNKEMWKHETHNGGAAEYKWTNINNTPEGFKLEVTTTRGEVCSNSWAKVVLKPNTVYRFSADVRTIGVTGEKGATLTLMGDWWSTAEYLKGTRSSNNISRIFLTDNLGIARICLCLGVNGQTSSGTVYFSNLKVEETKHTAIESAHFLLRIREEHAKSVSESSLNEWLSKMDDVYEQYKELVGGDPYPGIKTNIYAPEPSITAWGLAGNPIQVILSGVVPMLKGYQDKGDRSFGMMHEIGHNFNSGDGKFNDSDDRWNWNDEMFANFRMFYALDNLNGAFTQGSRLYTGAEATDYYKTYGGESYDNMFLQNKYSHDGLMWTLIRAKNQIGWEPFRKLFREFYSKPNPSNQNNWQKFQRFINTLTKYADIDVMSTYSQKELQIIKDNI